MKKLCYNIFAKNGIRKNRRDENDEKKNLFMVVYTLLVAHGLYVMLDAYGSYRQRKRQQ